jgi:signal peptidase
MEQKKLKSMNYIGSSMNPALKPGDRLDTVPYDGQKIRRGDVVVFISPLDGSKVVHRVVSVDSKGIKTRGDNCNRIDPWVLRPDQIIGRVISVHRRNRRRRIFGGYLGRVFAEAARALITIDFGASLLLRPFYDRLARSGIFRYWKPVWLEPRVISFSHSGGNELQLLMGRWVIGRRLPGMTQWNIRRPFRLFVDENSLPRNPSGQSS